MYAKPFKDLPLNQVLSLSQGYSAKGIAKLFQLDMTSELKGREFQATGDLFFGRGFNH